MNLEMLITNYPYFIAIIVFGVGTLIVLTQPNLVKKVIGLNIMSNAIFLFFIALGDIHGGEVPIVDPAAPATLYINPLPSALILTGIVVGFSVTAFALALIVKLYYFYGTINAPDFMKMR
jgi:multicomponent Na+:H+ antiporter subunit C